MSQMIALMLLVVQDKQHQINIYILLIISNSNYKTALIILK